MKSDVVADAIVVNVSADMLSGDLCVVKEIDINTCRSVALDFGANFSLQLESQVITKLPNARANWLY